MHYLCGVVVPAATTRETAEDAVEPLMAPFNEQENEDSGWWDYWTVGGRWTAVWSRSYKPRENPRNYESACLICGGTGQRQDIGDMTREEYIAWVGGCNGCYGTGSRMKWDQVPFIGDVISVDLLLSGKTYPGWGSEKDWSFEIPFRLVLPDGTTPSRERWIQGDETFDHYPGYSEDLENKYDELSSEEWLPIATDALKPWLGSRIVAVDYHS